MQQQFEIPILEKGVKRNQVTAIHLMAGLLLIAMSSITLVVPDGLKAEARPLLNTMGIVYMISGGLILVVSIFFNKKVIQKKANLALRLLEILLFLPIFVYSLIQQWYLPATYAAAAILAILLAYYWEKRGVRTKKAIINETGVHLPLSGTTKSFPWQDINKLMFRHRILTIDCKNNRLIQLNVPNEPDNNALPTQSAIEKYSNQQIIVNKNKITDDW